MSLGHTATKVGVLVALAVATAAPAQAAPERRWEATFDVRIVPTEGVAHVVVRLGRRASLVDYVRFRVDPDRHAAFEGDGAIEVDGRYVRWVPPKGGGELRYVFKIDHLRDAAHYDARMTTKWALFRGDHLVPPARVSVQDGSSSRSRLVLQLPKGWSIATPYKRGSDGAFEIDHPHRLFDRPTGWMVAGNLGVLRERVAGSAIAVAGPTDQGIRRQDILALLRWTLPTLGRIAGTVPPRLLVVSAGDPMWRGGLSGPASLFVHAERPLISADLTSPMLHEIVHVMMGARAGDDGDWIVEGLAEYYSLQALVRSRTVSQRRYERALERIIARGRKAKTLRVARADRNVTNRAVGVLAKLDQRMRDRTGDRVSLDDVLARLARARHPVTTARLQQIVEKLTGVAFGPFFERHVR
jgi:hypothetical protein